MKKLCLISALFLAMMLSPLSASAVPNLVVAPTGTGGTYYGDYDGYLDYWADYFLPETSAYHGFAIPSSGGGLSIAADFSDIGDEHIYLVMNSAGNSYGVSYGGNPFQLVTDYAAIDATTQIDGYVGQPYWGIDIGTIKDSNGNLNLGWTPITDSAFGGGQYYEYSAALTYGSSLPDGLYFFAIVDDNEKNPKTLTGDNLASNDTFSPKTASSGNFAAVPEPATMLLLGSGLAGLAGLRRKMRRR